MVKTSLEKYHPPPPLVQIYSCTTRYNHTPACGAAWDGQPTRVHSTASRQCRLHGPQLLLNRLSWFAVSQRERCAFEKNWSYLISKKRVIFQSAIKGMLELWIQGVETSNNKTYKSLAGIRPRDAKVTRLKFSEDWQCKIFWSIHVNSTGLQAWLMQCDWAYLVSG